MLKNAVLISGLPGSGYVGKLAVDHLIAECGAENFCEIYSDFFPPHVYIKPDGSTDIIKNQLFYWKNQDSGHDLVLFTGDAQPVSGESEYEIVEKVLGVVSTLGVRRVYSLAAYIMGGFVENPRVYATATAVDLLKELEPMGVTIMSEGSITGMNGLLVGLAKLKGLEGACLLGETSGYIIDARASKAVLEVLTKALGLSVDLGSLEKRASETEALIRLARDAQQRSAERTAPQPRQTGSEVGYIS